MLLSSFWDQFLQSLEKTRIEKQETSPSLIYSLLKQLRPIDLSEEKVILGCNNPTVRSFLEKKIPEIQDVLSRYLEKKMKVELTVIEVKKTEKKTPLLNYQPALSDVLYKTGLHVKYSFDNFAVSSTNQVAYAASQAVTNGLGHTYNPLFLYGGVGVGKTHLAQAVGRKILEQDQERKVLFGPADQFINELIESIREKSTAKFRRKYRRLDLLIMDDVQFLSKKEKSQEELFHLFNALHDTNKQIVFSSDRAPIAIADIADRLKGRLASGMTVDIGEPDLESRVAIIHKKAAIHSVLLSDEVIEYVAGASSGSIRELEGMVNSIVCFAQVRGVAPDIAEVRQALRSFARPQKNISIKHVVNKVAQFYGIDEESIYEKTRRREVVRPRQVIMYILREDFNISYPTIGVKLGGRDHTTVIHSCEKIKREVVVDNELLKEIQNIRSLLV